MKEGWAVASLEEIANATLGKMLDKSKNRGIPRPYLRNLNVRWFDFDLSDVLEMRFEDGEYERYTAKKGDLLICEGGYPGRAAIWDHDDPIHFQKAIHRVRFHEPRRAKWFQYYLYLCDIDGTLPDHFTGTGIQHFTGEALKRFRIPLPPLAEQERIVAILDEAFAGLAIATANAEKYIEDARELFDSRLSRQFESAGQGHARRRLGDIVTRLTNGYVGPTRDIYLETGVPYLLARHVRDNRLEFDGKTFVSDDFNEKNKKSKLKTGDVLLVQSGHIGHSAVVDSEHEGHNCHAMIVMTPIPEQLSGEFLSLYFCSAQMKRKFEEIRSGSTVPHLTCGLVRELMIALPEIDEQQRLVAELKGLEAATARLVSLASAKLSALRRLKQSILRKAFSGELALPPSQAAQEAAE
jgi:type I restriction enzyme, S subunit